MALRYLRITVVGTVAEEHTGTDRRTSEGRVGGTIGYAIGGRDGGQPAAGLTLLVDRRRDARLLLGRTLGKDDAPKELLFGLTMGLGSD